MSICSKSAWVLEPGASHYITFNSQYFLNIFPSNILYIIIVEDSRTLINGRGDIDFQYFKLKDVFHVSGLSNNVISICKLIEDNNCTVNIFYSHCTFQDLAT